MNVTKQRNMLVILLLMIPLCIVIITIITDRDIYLPNENTSKDVELYFFLNSDKDISGDFILLPAFITENNETVFNVKEYIFDDGTGNVEMEIINGTKYLNISISSTLKIDGNYEISFSAKKDIDFKQKIIVDHLIYKVDNESKVRGFFSGAMIGNIMYRIILHKDMFIAGRDWAHSINISGFIIKSGWNNISVEISKYKI